MLRRVYAVVCSLAVLVASAGAGMSFGAATASADPFGRSAEQLQAINVVIARAVAARGVPFTYGGGNANGPTRGEPRAAASITDSAATDAAAPTVSVPPALGGLNLTPAATPAPAVAPDPAADVVGFDASGLIVYAFGGVGVKMPRSSGEQYQAVRKVQPSAALPGDLLFYGPEGTQSVALFIGNGQMVEVGDRGVAVSPVRTTDMTPYLGRIIG